MVVWVLTQCSVGRLKMEATWSPEMLISYCVTTAHHNPEEHNLNLHCCEDLIACITLSHCKEQKY